MTTNNQLGDANELARRFVACKGWRWPPGLLDVDGDRLVWVGATGEMVWASSLGMLLTTAGPTKELPDLSDAATQGCILVLVREAWGDPLAYVGYFAPHWKVIGSHQHKTENPASWGCLLGRGDTEAEALLSALEAAQ